MSGKLDIVIEQGATFSRVLTIADSDSNPINISNDSFRGAVRANYKSAVEGVFDFALFTDGSDGRISITMSAAETAAMNSGRNFVYDIEWVKANTEVVRILEGNVQVTAEVTR